MSVQEQTAPSAAPATRVPLTLRIRRYNPERGDQPWWDEFEIQAEPTDRLLDALHEVKWHHDGTLALIEKVRDSGIAVLVTRNHGHFGAAGLYSRTTVADTAASLISATGMAFAARPGDGERRFPVPCCPLSLRERAATVQGGAGVRPPCPPGGLG